MKRILCVLGILLSCSLVLHAEYILTAGIGRLPLMMNYNGHPLLVGTQNMSFTMEGVAFNLDALIPLKNSRMGLYGALHLGSVDSFYAHPASTSTMGIDTTKDSGYILEAKAGAGWFLGRGIKWSGFAGMALVADFINYEYTFYDMTGLANNVITMKHMLLGISDTIQVHYFFTPRYGIMAAADYTLLFIPVKFEVASNDVWYDLAGHFKNARSFNLRFGASLKF